MVELAAASIACAAPRVVTLQLGYGDGKWNFAWEGINMNVHAELAHRDTSDEGSTPENTAQLIKMNRYYATLVGKLARKLAGISEGGGTVLDSTLIVWANEMERGDHNLGNLPIALIGGAGRDVIGPGGRLIDVGKQPFQRLGCTILRAMGLRAEGSGNLPDCGPLQGL